MKHALTKIELSEMLQEARSRTLALVSDLTDEQLIGPRLEIVNPLLWEIGHVAWFQEKWALRHLRGVPAQFSSADALYDSAAIAHDTRWDLRLPSRAETLLYMSDVLSEVTERLGDEPVVGQELYFHLLGLFHEDMHAEAIAYTRQTLGYAAPRFAATAPADAAAGPLPGDVEVPGGSMMLGATPELPFVFDNEKWSHPVELKAFRMARAPVTNREFLHFVEDEGYKNERWWSDAGRAWRDRAGARYPVYWRRAPQGGWQRRVFDQWQGLDDHSPVLHVNWFEAEAYCAWAGRRLPTEAEWERAATFDPERGLHRGPLQGRRLYPWGDEPPEPARANLDWTAAGCLQVGALPQGDSACGCRQMLGNLWEWTASDFLPYPGFKPDPYAEYSAPWFGDHKVLRGGCWATRARLIRNTWRNFYKPDRRDVWCGFRTCAL
jgi:iron(II)-dependent oxidoreductase